MAKAKTCAACKMHRKRCKKECVLAPYFPSKDPHRFAVAQRVFGTSNILKTLQGVPKEQRADAVNNMVCEATARLHDPIHGSSTSVHQLQKKIAELESQLASTRAELEITRQNYQKLASVLMNGCHDCEQPRLYGTGTTCQYEDDYKSDHIGELWTPLWEM